MSSLAIIGVFWNPCNHERLASNMEIWRRTLPRDPAVEVWLAEVLVPGQEPQVPPGPRTVRFEFSDIICCVESVRNAVINKYVTDVDAVMCLDADILYDRPDWWKIVMASLDRYPIMQGFDTAHWLDRRGRVGKTKRSIAWGYQHGQLGSWPLKSVNLHTGFSWAARRDLWSIVKPGMPDWLCLGANDRALALACTDRKHPDWDGWWEQRLNIYTETFRKWMGTEEFGYAPLELVHLWHGDEKNRLYEERRSRLRHVHWPEHCCYTSEGLLAWTEKGRFMHEGWLRKIWMNRER